MLINKEKHIFLLSSKSNLIFKILRDDITIKSLDIKYLSQYFKDSQYLLITNTAIDHIHKYNRFLLSYVFVNYSIGQRIYINFNTSSSVPSINDIFSSSIWLEREVYDLFGIFFNSNSNNNDLRRILTDYNFKGHPLRKDFTLIGYNEKFFSYKSKTIKNRKDFSF